MTKYEIDQRVIIIGSFPEGPHDWFGIIDDIRNTGEGTEYNVRWWDRETGFGKHCIQRENSWFRENEITTIPCGKPNCKYCNNH